MIIELIRRHIIHFSQGIVFALVAVLPAGVAVLADIPYIKTADPLTAIILYFFYLLIVFLLVKKLIHLEKDKRFRRRNEYLQLQFQFTQKQLDTHFTFNILNSISASILRNDKKEAHKQLTVFSKVLRYVFDDKKSLLHRLDKELELTENYLILEKYRFKNKFDYNINIHGQVNRLTKVPKQIIQIFVDNAIKHGFMPLDEGGYLQVSIGGEDDYIYIIVEDNGVGREEASKQNKLERKGISVKIMQQIIDYLNKIDRKQQLELQIFDLYKNGDSSGTRVEISIPSGYNPRIA